MDRGPKKMRTEGPRDQTKNEGPRDRGIAKWEQAEGEQRRGQVNRGWQGHRNRDRDPVTTRCLLIYYTHFKIQHKIIDLNDRLRIRNI